MPSQDIRLSQPVVAVYYVILLNMTHSFIVCTKCNRQTINGQSTNHRNCCIMVLICPLNFRIKLLATMYSQSFMRTAQPFSRNLAKGVFIATQLNSTQLTQLNSVQPISAKQVRRVFVYDVMTYKLSQLGHYVH